MEPVRMTPSAAEDEEINRSANWEGHDRSICDDGGPPGCLDHKPIDCLAPSPRLVIAITVRTPGSTRSMVAPAGACVPCPFQVADSPSPSIRASPPAPEAFPSEPGGTTATGSAHAAAVTGALPEGRKRSEWTSAILNCAMLVLAGTKMRPATAT